MQCKLHTAHCTLHTVQCPLPGNCCRPTTLSSSRSPLNFCSPTSVPFHFSISSSSVCISTSPQGQSSLLASGKRGQKEAKRGGKTGQKGAQQLADRLAVSWTHLLPQRNKLFGDNLFSRLGNVNTISNNSPKCLFAHRPVRLSTRPEWKHECKQPLGVARVAFSVSSDYFTGHRAAAKPAWAKPRQLAPESGHRGAAAMMTILIMELAPHTRSGAL